MSNILKLLLPKEIREQRRLLYAENQKYPAHLIEVPREQWPKGHFSLKAVVIAVWRSKDFLVQIYNERGRVRLSVCRTMIDSDGNYIEGIDWETMQRLKRECGFEGFDAVEIYPKDMDIVNVANMRHLWILRDDELPFIWRAKHETQEIPADKAS